MSFPVFDYRDHIQNVLVAPEIRGRFMHLPAGQSSAPHTHDLGWEIFLILQRRVQFTADDPHPITNHQSRLANDE